jgi:hypothetical protein
LVKQPTKRKFFNNENKPDYGIMYDNASCLAGILSHPPLAT